ncbi:hypothetical protein [Haladaptatus sp. CMAA 1911]|uniref:DUF7573 domain-containing protein n=1 Tax=unclassified Haladaptatus TaxID=2622732 RepID=UPI0037548313
MSEDRSLSDFAGKTGESDETEEAGEPSEREESAEVPEVDESAEVPEVEPARATYDWTPTGAACACCGSTVEKRWRDEDGMVCADCKEW